MPKYLLQVNYTTEGAKGLIKDGGSKRRAAAQAAAESVGGRIESMYRDVLSGAQPNDVIGPMQLDAGDGRPKFAVIRVLEMRPEGEYSFDDLRDQMRNVLSEQNAMQRMLRSLREATYVEIRL